jgi:hypothetical protein
LFFWNWVPLGEKDRPSATQAPLSESGSSAPTKLLLSVDAGITVKLFVLVAVPPGVVTLSGPVVAPAGTVA